MRHQLLVITLQLILTASHDVAWAVLHKLLINDGNRVATWISAHNTSSQLPRTSSNRNRNKRLATWTGTSIMLPSSVRVLSFNFFPSIAIFRRQESKNCRWQSLRPNGFFVRAYFSSPTYLSSWNGRRYSMQRYWERVPNGQHECRHATISWGNPYFFSENLYQSVSLIDASMYRDTFHAIRIAMQFAKKCDIVKQNPQPAAQTRGCYPQTGTESRSPCATARLGQCFRSIALHERRNLQFFGNLAVKASFVNDQTFVSLHILKQLFFSNLPQIRITR